MIEFVRDLDRGRIYKDLAKKHGLLIGEVRRIVESEFNFVANVMRRGELESVRLPLLGTFQPVKPGRIKYIRERMRLEPKHKPK